MPKSYEDLMARGAAKVRYVRVPLEPALYALVAAKGRQMGAKADGKRVPNTRVICALLEAALVPEAAALRKL